MFAQHLVRSVVLSPSIMKASRGETVKCAGEQGP